MKNKKDYYHYKLSGLDNVYLANGFKLRKSEYGDTVSINDIDGLHKAIANILISKKEPLEGKEIRFLRKLIDLSQAGLASMLCTEVQTLARWEKGQTHIPGAADMLLRLIYWGSLGERGRITKQIERLKDLDDQSYGGNNDICLKATDNHWEAKKRA